MFVKRIITILLVPKISDDENCLSELANLS